MDFAKVFAHMCENDGKESLGETYEDEQAELKCISTIMAKFPKKNTKRPRVAVITNSANPVILAFYDKEADEMKHLEVEVPKIP